MATKINAKATGGGFEVVPDASGVMEIQSSGVTAISIAANQNVTFAGNKLYTGSTGYNGNIYVNSVYLNDNPLTAGESGLTYSGQTVMTSTSSVLNPNKGGTGRNTLTTNNVILGNGLDPVQMIAPGTEGNVLTSTGTSWISNPLPPAIGVGINQTWLDVTSIRALNTTYTNSTGKPIFVMISVYNSQSANILLVTVSGVLISAVGQSTWDNSTQASFIVPDGATYSAASSSGVRIWAELR